MVEAMNASNPLPEPRRKAAKVVLLKDEGDPRTRVEAGLRSVGLETLAVESREEYLACVRDQETSLAVLDVFMHHTDALRMLLVTRQMRPRLPMILITQAPLGSQRAVPLDNGSDEDWERQDFDPAVIADCIQACLDNESEPAQQKAVSCPSID